MTGCDSIGKTGLRNNTCETLSIAGGIGFLVG